MLKAAKLDSIRNLKSGKGETERSHYFNESSVSALQAAVQRFPALYAAIKAYLSPSWSWKSWKSFIPSPTDQVVVNLGAGTTRLHPEIINVDFVAFPHIDVIADMNSTEPWPLKDSSVDAMVCISVLEHLRNPPQVIAEIARVLKPGGLIYLAVPFQYPFHGAPEDYSRWTVPGITRLLGSQFEIRETGSRGGAFGVVILALAHFIARALSFGSGTVYSVTFFATLGILAPLKLIDLALAPLPFDTTLCPGIYAVAARRP